MSTNLTPSPIRGAETEKHLAFEWLRKVSIGEDDKLSDEHRARLAAVAMQLVDLKAARPEELRLSALRELVRLKDLHDLIECIAFNTLDEYRAAVQEYNAKKSKAWAAARGCLDTAPSPLRRSECPYCTSDNEAIRSTYYDQTCEGCVKRMGQ